MSYDARGRAAARFRMQRPGARVRPEPRPLRARASERDLARIPLDGLRKTARWWARERGRQEVDLYFRRLLARQSRTFYEPSVLGGVYVLQVRFYGTTSSVTGATAG